MKHTIHDHHFTFDVDRLISKETIRKHPKHQRFMDIAKNVSELSTYDCYRLGAIIVVKGTIIAKGFNKAKTHPQQKKYNAVRFDISDKSQHHIHAEFDAIMKAKNVDLSEAEIYVYHIGKKGEQKMARPCAGCMAAIKKHGIKVVHYSTPEGLATEYISKENLIQVKRAKHLI
jgi:deoxycytidylate deaminase